MLPNLLLIVDLETTGLDPNIDRVIEVGAILYSVPCACTLQQFSTLFKVDENPAEKINKISVKASQTLDRSLCLQSLLLLSAWINQADYIVAHNAQFDRQWFGKDTLPKIEKKWLCTYDDFVWSKNEQPTSLINTALNYGIGVSNAHRALTDCQLIAALFDRVSESGDLDKIILKAIRRSEEPKIKVIANVSYENRNLAKQFRFRWNSEEKNWIKELRKSDLNQEIDNYPFSITLDN